MYRSKLLLVTTILLVFTMFFLVACGNQDNEKSSNTDQTPIGTDDKINKSESDEDVSESDVVDPYGKYDPPIEVTFVRSMQDQPKTDETGGTVEDNVWTKLIEEELGIKVKYNWVSSFEQYSQKINLMLVSGDLPDFFSVDATVLKQLVESDVIEPIGDVFEKYKSPETTEVYDSHGSVPFDSATFNGQIMGIPRAGASVDEALVLWVRNDWLKKLGLPEPKTMDDVLKISEAFTTQDPDGNGKDDTIGLSMNKNLWGSIEGFFNGFHAYPRIWIEDGSGKLVIGTIQPEVKEGLKALNNMFAAGQLDKEFGVKEASKVNEMIASGKCGLLYGKRYAPMEFVSSVKNNPEAEWSGYPIVSVDEQPARPQIKLNVAEYAVAKKGTEHPEAVVKILNLFVRTAIYDVDDEVVAKYVSNEEYGEVYKFCPIMGLESATKNTMQYEQISEAIQTGDSTRVTFPIAKRRYEMVKSYYDEGNLDGWAFAKVFGPDGGQSIISYYKENDLTLMDKFIVAPTQSMIDKGATLDKLEAEVFLKIILGEAPADDFDKFVEDWKNLGGNDITEEVNEWYSNAK